jgi:spore maturation protein CgeB
VGEEILCYATRDEMLELVRRCVAEPERARAVARAGRERCLREHTWRHRFLRVLEVLGVIEPAAR